jgi:alanine-synthesizing transaminase
MSAISRARIDVASRSLDVLSTSLQVLSTFFRRSLDETKVLSVKAPPFSARTAWDLTDNPLGEALARARASERPLVDLTEGNPTRVGLIHEGDARALVARLGHPRGVAYAPAAFGHDEARAAVARYYEERGLAVDPARVALAASTSEAYGWLFKLLADRGDEVLIPKPSYPLFAFLADLEDVRLVPYPLVREEGFRIDMAALEAAVNARTRAVMLVHPNNPTGTFVRRDEAAELEALSARRGLALIVDEVFGDYPRGPLPSDRLPSFVGPRKALTFVLSGLSKVAALPQLKLAWIAAMGPDEIVASALARLEVIADTYLSVSTPVQLALPELLAARGPIHAAILARVGENLAALDEAIAATPGCPVRRLPADAGWYAILEVPRTRDEDAWAAILIGEDGVVVHPGYFFDMEQDGFLVVSLVPEPSVFHDGIERLLRRVAQG